MQKGTRLKEEVALDVSEKTLNLSFQDIDNLLILAMALASPDRNGDLPKIVFSEAAQKVSDALRKLKPSPSSSYERFAGDLLEWAKSAHSNALRRRNQQSGRSVYSTKDMPMMMVPKMHAKKASDEFQTTMPSETGGA